MRRDGGADYWAQRARHFHAAVMAGREDDPFLARVRGVVGPETTVLDVGAGTGRFALPLARRARRVIALDPSAAMLDILEEEAQQHGVRNIEVVRASWPEAAVPPADVVICAHVLYPIAEIAPFLRALAAATRHWVFIYLRCDQRPDESELWQAFYGAPRAPQPTFIDLYNVLWQLGIRANAEIVEATIGVPTELAQAIADYRPQLFLPDTPEVNARLAEALKPILARGGRRRSLAGIASWARSEFEVRG